MIQKRENGRWRIRRGALGRQWEGPRCRIDRLWRLGDLMDSVIIQIAKFYSTRQSTDATPTVPSPLLVEMWISPYRISRNTASRDLRRRLGRWIHKWLGLRPWHLVSAIFGDIARTARNPRKNEGWNNCAIDGPPLNGRPGDPSSTHVWIHGVQKNESFRAILATGASSILAGSSWLRRWDAVYQNKARCRRRTLRFGPGAPMESRGAYLHRA